MTYSEALAYIASLEPRGWRLGLDRMWELARRAGLPGSLGEAGGPQYIHVAGTNGKGSVTAFLQGLLVESGYNTGAFFSPYVFDPRERVQHGRGLISEQELAGLTEGLRPIAESLTDSDFGGVTEFEFKTALGFLYWKAKRCEWVALEVGLGGRLDATNIVTPRASVIVSIGLDHTAILGDTHAKIAFEKAGVIKPGVPVIVGEMPDEAREVIVNVAKTLDAPVWHFGRDIFAELLPEGITVRTPSNTYSGLKSGLYGRWQPHNLALALAALEASGARRSVDQVHKGAARASAPGRFQVVEALGRRFILDGAHNAEAAESLRDSLESWRANKGSKLVLVSGMVAGHDPLHFYEPLAEIVDEIHLIPVDFHRALAPTVIAEGISGLHAKVLVHATADEGLAAAVAANSDILVAGSFYLVGEIGRLLGIT